tara:strand:+ start:44 stop:1003 length:960 start_codon:yes stop_codon:yes gene_type:complete
MKKKNILITGGLGLLGRSLIKKLLKEKHSIYVIDKKKNSKRNTFLNKNVKFFYGNFVNKQNLKKILLKKKIEVIFHIGAITQVLEAQKKPLKTYKTNIMGTINIIEAIRETNKNIILIYSSSDKAYGEIKDRNYLENDSLNSIYPYDLSKSCSDLICQSYSKVYGMKVAILRCGNLYGPGDFNKNRIIPETILSALKEKQLIIRSNGKLIRDYLFVDDATNAYYLVMKKLISTKKKMLIYNVGSKYNLSVLSLVKLILKEMNKEYLKPIIKNYSKKEIKFQKLNYSKISKELKWNQKTNMKLGLHQTLMWYRKNQKLFK